MDNKINVLKIITILTIVLLLMHGIMPTMNKPSNGEPNDTDSSENTIKPKTGTRSRGGSAPETFIGTVRPSIIKKFVALPPNHIGRDYNYEYYNGDENSLSFNF